jgi:hypothetical protein
MKAIVLILLIIPGLLQAQIVLKKDNISTSGNSIQNNNKMLVYTVGEVAVKEHSVNTKTLSEGFITPDIFTNTNYENYGVLQSVQIYPNPVRDVLHFEFHYISDFEISIYDLNGKQLWQKRLNNDNHININIKDYKSGVYILVVKDNTQKKLLMTKIEKT